MIDAQEVKREAAGRWPEILSSVAGLPREALDGKHRPCPRCGGKDRFRLLSQEDGAVICNRCFCTRNGDGLAAIQWATGCSFPEAVQSVAEYLGMAPPNAQKSRQQSHQSRGDNHRSNGKAKEAYPTPEAAVAALARKRGQPSGKWEYRNAQGELVGVVLRFDRQDGGKDVLPVSRRAGGWVMGAMPEPRPLYRLPALLKADPSQPVAITEGEKAADAAVRVGLSATTSSGGSNAASKSDWSPVAGRQVWVLPDNDVPGEKYAQAVTRLAYAAGASTVRVLHWRDLAPGRDLDEGFDLADLASECQSDDDLVGARQAVEQAAAEVEPEPRPECKLKGYAPFPVHTLPEPVRGFVDKASSSIGCDPSYVAVPLLCCLASAIGATRRVQLKEGWTEPSVLWGVIVGRSGTAKSPAWNLATEMLRRAQESNLDEYQAELERFNQLKVMYDADLAIWKREGRKQGDPPPEKPEEPRLVRYVVSDTTVEALADRLDDSPRGLITLIDEAGAWLRSFDAYRQGRGGDLPRWLSMYRAESLLVDRKATKEPLYIQRAAVSLTGTITPSEFRQAMAGEHEHNGLLARLLVACPPPKPKRWTDATLPQDLRQATQRIFDRLLSLDFTTDEKGKPVPQDLPLDGEARSAWIEFYNQHAQRQLDANDVLGAALAKLEGTAARIALVIHCVRQAAGVLPVEDDRIDAASITAGIELARWFAQEFERVYATFGESDDQRELRQLAELVESRGGRVSPRDIRHNGFGGDTSAAEQALQKLVAAGLGHWECTTPTKSGGRPKRVFVLQNRNTETETPKNAGNT